MSNEVIHDVLYALHRKQPLPADALVNDFERRCKRISGWLRWVLLGSFVLVGALAAPFYFLESGSISSAWALAIRFALAILVAAAMSWCITDAAPLVRELFRFDVYHYHVRQLQAAHDLAQANDLQRFGSAALALTEKWLTLRIERVKLHLGMYVGGSDKVAILAVLAGAWAIWHNFPRSAGSIEQYLYVLAGLFLAGTGIGGMSVNAIIARLAYQRDLVTIAICLLANARRAQAEAEVAA